MEELWAECERQGWRDRGEVKRLIAALERTGQHERAAEAQRNYDMRCGPECGNLGPLPWLPAEAFERTPPEEITPEQMTPEYIQSRIEILQRIAKG